MDDWKLDPPEPDPKPTKPPASWACSDGFCGATDCPRCHPENFEGGVYVGD